MKLLITGGTGLLGSAIVEQVAGQYEVLAPSRRELDLENGVAVAEYVEKHQPTLCIHAAAHVFGLGGHKLHPNKALLLNSKIDLNLISALNEIKLEHLVYVGTVASYGYPYREVPLLESDFLSGVPHAGEYGYAMAKRFGYDLANSLKLNGTTVTYAVMTNLFGPRDNFNEQTGHVIPSLISRALTAKKENTLLDVWGQRDDSRDFLFSGSAATRIIQLLNLRYDGLINVGSGVERKIYEVAGLIASHVGLKGINSKVGAVNAIHNRTLNIEKLNQMCGTLPGDFEVQITETIDWLIANNQVARR